MPHHYYEMTHETLALLSGQGNEVGAGGLALCRVPRRARPVSSVTQPLPCPPTPPPNHTQGARGERLVREIMVVDEVSWDDAQPVFHVPGTKWAFLFCFLPILTKPSSPPSPLQERIEQERIAC